MPYLNQPLGKQNPIFDRIKPIQPKKDIEKKSLPVNNRVAPKSSVSSKKNENIFKNTSSLTRYQLKQKLLNHPDVKNLALKQGMPYWEMAETLVKEMYPEKYGALLSPDESKSESRGDRWETKREIGETVRKPKNYIEAKKRLERTKLIEKII